MKIKYRVSDGEILAFGSMPNLKAADGEAVEEVSGEMPQGRLDLYKRTEAGKVEMKEEAEVEKIKSIQNFNVDLMTAHIGEVVTPLEAVDLAPYLGALQSYCKAKNFKGAKDFVIALVSLKKATKEQAEKIKDVLLRQGVDLDTFS